MKRPSLRGAGTLGLLSAIATLALAYGVSVAEVPFDDAQVVVGDPTAPVELMEYLSATCTHCAAFYRDVFPRLLHEQIETGRVRLVVRELPTAPLAVSAAGFLLARCAGREAYWTAVQDLLRKQASVLASPTTSAAIEREAEIVGLSPDTAHDCLQDEARLAALNDRRAEALASGIDSTPTFFVNGHKLEPGLRLAGLPYEGGEMSYPQLAAALKKFGKVRPQRAAPASPPT